MSVSKRKKEYYKYLNSPEWAKIRADIFFLTGGKCEYCGKKGWQVHHKTYKNLGNENPEDLLLLCGDCHQIEHGLLKRKKKQSKQVAPKNKKKKKRRKKISRAKKRQMKEVQKAKEIQEAKDRIIEEKSQKRLEERLKKFRE